MLVSHRQQVEDEYNDTVRALEEVNERMKNKLNKYRNAQKKRVALITRLQQEREELENTKQQYYEENNDLRERLGDSTFQANMKIAELQEKVNILEQENKRLLTDTTAKSVVDDLHKQIEKLQGEHKEQMEKQHEEHKIEMDKKEEEYKVLFMI